MANNIEKIEKWLFEYSPDILAGGLSDPDTTVPDENPIAPVDHMANQISKEAPPIEDEEYVPATIKELSAAADLIASKCPDRQVEFFYRELLNLLESAIERENNPDVADAKVTLPDAFDPPVAIRQSESKTLLNHLIESSRDDDDDVYCVQ